MFIAFTAFKVSSSHPFLYIFSSCSEPQQSKVKKKKKKEHAKKKQKTHFYMFVNNVWTLCY